MKLVYSIEDKVAFTGVGLLDNLGATHLVAPLHTEARWDNSESSIPVGVLRQSPVDGRYGFPFHEACWSLLQQAYSPRPIPLTRLFEVCRSLPVSHQTDCLTWDHDYGGLISIDSNSYPWENLLILQELDFAASDPYLVPEIQQLRHEPSILPDASRPPTPRDAAKPLSTNADIFANLPLEIITSISLHLSTRDYLSCRLASRSYLPVFYARQFWASRFLPYADRSWVFEAQTWDTACDWLWLYRRTANGSDEMKNRQRVWQLIEKVKEILGLKWIEPAPCSIPDKAESRWLEAAGGLRPGTGQSYQVASGGCRRHYVREVHIPPDQLSHLAVSLIQSSDTTYITGIRLVLNQGEAICLGYMADKEHILNGTGLTGFQLAVGSRGIQAIRCILNKDRESLWIGSPDNAPRTERLLFAEPITGIKAGFDVSMFPFYL